MLSYAEGMERLLQVMQELSVPRSLDGVTAIVRRAARELSGADGATFVLHDGPNCYYVDEDAIGPLWKGKRFPLDACISGWAMKHREQVVIEDIYADPRIPHDAYRPTFVQSLAMTPIRIDDPIAAIGIYWARTHRPSQDQLRLLQALANSASIAMANVELFSDLERRVAERTAQLQASNHELETFSSAVSHDLRAPLRAIDAFTLQLGEDHGEALGSLGRATLDRVRGAVKRMQGQIESLLDMSRIARAPLARVEVDLAPMAREVLGELQRAAPERVVHVAIEPELRVNGDPRLLRLVLDNLLSNAWKFTRHQPRARIEIGRRPDGAIYISDNGAGFDPTYTEKLFAPFQRLHSAEQFEGTGVGLATVQRIIRRHGGEIRAEGSPGQGATFWFTL